MPQITDPSKRKPLKYGVPTESRRINLPAEVWRRAEEAGHGNVSEGIARLLGYERTDRPKR
jgi:hypothetical protein